MQLIDADKLHNGMIRRVVDNLRLMDTWYEGYLTAMVEVEEMINELENVGRETEWCEHCELWKEDNCIGVAQCKQNIKALKKLSDLVECETKMKVEHEID